jgi:uncharacterized membrane protein HdeD (DUF308 family)
MVHHICKIFVPHLTKVTPKTTIVFIFYFFIYSFILHGISAISTAVKSQNARGFVE